MFIFYKERQLLSGCISVTKQVTKVRNILRFPLCTKSANKDTVGYKQVFIVNKIYFNIGCVQQYLLHEQNFLGDNNFYCLWNYFVCCVSVLATFFFHIFFLLNQYIFSVLKICVQVKREQQI
eukprot:TRINITY_DN35550_c0_g2_i9.p5 TRINITY_DN35550_c0_g2~~TRINITY_DN35550_c0_g2_i9.p5  ORF type:complete len:122 (-),score=3.88 TRINITY_DN35550_c0_g2_i9:703-1068(-)